MKTRMKQLAIVLLALFFFAACNNAKKDKDVIKIGAILPLTGKYSDIGNWEKAGLLLAMDEISKTEAKYKFEILIEDAKSEPKEAISAYNKLKNINNVSVFLTTTSALSLAVKPLTIKDSVLFFSIASHPGITLDNNGLIFRPCNTSTEESKAISDYIASNYSSSNDKTFIIFHNSEFGIAFKDQISNFSKNRIIGVLPYDDNPDSYKSIIANVLKSKPDIIAVIGFTPNLGILIKTLRELNFKGIIISNTGFNSPSVINTAGDAANGVKYVEYDFPMDSKHFQVLDSSSRAKYNIGFGSMSFLAYYTVKLIDYAANESGSSSIFEIAKILRTQGVIKIDNQNFKLHENGNIFPNLSVKEYGKK